ncbi:MAG: polysaccharide deacetylase [Proteobacteria bacterium]|nr:MAG: polysaccharide deacetylase [Pseudomonadota bacterium]
MLKFSCFLILVCAISVTLFGQTKTIAITFDDLPYASLGPSLTDVYEARQNIRSILETLKAHNVPVVAFVNEKKLTVNDQLDMRVGLLEQWLDGGVELGNHTYSHPNLNKTSLPEFEDEVIKGEVITRRLMKERGKDERYFRHPFLMTGDTLEHKHEFEAFLKSRGYTVAPVTLENLDWAFNAAYRQAMKDDGRDTANKVLDAYLTQTDIDLDYYEKMTQSLFGRQIAHVMLMHSNQINGMLLDKVLAKFEARGYKFVTLDEALKDPAYQTADNYAGPYGYPWQHRWAMALGKDQDLKGVPDPPKWVWELYKKASGAL